MSLEMRLTPWPLIAAVLLFPSPLMAQDAAAQQAASGTSAPSPGTLVLPDPGLSNLVDVGLRGTAFTTGSDEARFQRYRDLRNGPTLDLFQYGNENEMQGITAHAEHVGHRDQRYWASYNSFGKLKLSFEWNQIPLFYSQDTATLYTSTGAGILNIDDAIRGGIQNKTMTLADAVGQARVFDLRSQRDVLDLKLTYSANPHLDWNVAFRNTTKTGNQPWAGTFGFGDAVELPVPIDTRTTELGTAIEWASSRGMARLGYDGSFFRNNISTLVWDNPLRLTDSATAGPSQGHMALWPNSDLNAGSAMGALNLPARSRATAYLSLGNWSQNDPLIPFTTNSALPTIPLDRATAEARARVTAMNYSFTSKPTDLLWLSARYRSYDFDNRTPVFHVARTIAYDTAVETYANGGTSPYSLTRRTFDADASLTPTRYAAFRVGYTREQVDQTFRFLDSTTEDTLRLSADATSIGWLTLRAVYEHAKRVGSGFDEQALDDIGEQVSLRQFDISDRSSHRFSGIVQLTPVSALSFNGMVSIGKEERPGAVFGLRSNNNHSYSVGADFVPNGAVSLGVSYELEKYDALQASRQANPGPQFNDPTRDWTTDGADRVHTVAASMDLLKLWPKTDVRFSYNYSHAESVYVYGLAPNTTLPPVVQLPAVINQLQRGTVDIRYYLTRRVAVGGYYWYDQYRVNDFAQGSETLTTLAEPSFLMLGYRLRPYTASTVAGRVTYFW
jgi:MtrB/PioB family decaheme-associated outer membrane protein